METTTPARAADPPGTPAPPRLGHSPALSSGAGRAAARIAAFAVCQAAMIAGLGLLITGPARNLWPLSAEDALNEAFERVRNDALTTASAIASGAGDTHTVVGVTVLCCLALLLVPPLPRWRAALFLALAVWLQSLVFLLITEAVDRTRPDVERLDASPPTSSYTSGHTGAATALYAGLAVLVLSRVRGRWGRPVAVLLLLIPLLVGLARLYRGMHHPSDVVAGLLNGALSLFVVGRAVLADDAWAARPRSRGGHRRRGRREPARPVARGRRGDRQSDRHRHRHPRPAARRPRATRAYGRDVRGDHRARHRGRPGGGRGTRRSGPHRRVRRDGTIRAVADALAGTGVTLAVVPCGTGNLLARNLGLPLAPADALAAALTGEPHALDLGTISGDGITRTHFTAMSGAGLDAAVMGSTSDRAKSALGWPAYVLAGLGELRGPRMRLAVTLDGAPALHRTARMVLIANIGTVQGGTALVPGARPDDGLLDLALFDPRGAGGWLRAVACCCADGRPTGSATGAHGGPVEFFTFRRAELTFTRPQPREVDGDPVAPGRRITAEVRPGALTVLLPAGEKQMGSTVPLPVREK
ncbi:phosphatase PAP2 family protein [Streptomyces sp. MT29]|nr:phosphatase PAP2 family protein [Streptomyces sp. MT29]